jgi:mannose-6-phosphate isomerase-like protein (cupin superfamily)
MLRSWPAAEVGRKLDLRAALVEDPKALTAPPAWVNGELARMRGDVVLHAGGGRLDGSWHSQDGDECLVVLAGELVVEFDEGPLRACAGEGILIGAGDRHRASVPVDCLLLSIEPVGMQRSE